MEEDDDFAVVIDCGSSICRAGFAGDDAPRSCFSSVVGKLRFQHEELLDMDSVVGDEAQISREFLSLKYPIERSIVTNWDDAEKLWEFCFRDLKVDSNESSVFMSEPVWSPAGYKEHLLESMFETFNVPKFFSHNSATLSLFSSGRGVGLVLDVGHGMTHLVPIYFGVATPQAICRQELAGHDVTLFLQKLLLARGYSFTTTSELEYVREIKEELCYTSMDYEKEVSGCVEDTAFTLPDGNKLTIGKEKFECAECLFKPDLMGYSGLKGLHELVVSCLDNCDVDNRKDFYTNVVLNGGGTMMPNLPERLNKLMRELVPPKMIFKSVQYPERKYAVWIGGSICASLSTFQEAFITKKDYEEFGPSIVHRRCL